VTGVFCDNVALVSILILVFIKKKVNTVLLMFQDRQVVDVNLIKNNLGKQIMKIIFNIAPFISKTVAAFERVIIQVINNSDFTLNKKLFFSIIWTELTPELKLQCRCLLQIKQLFNDFFGVSAIFKIPKYYSLALYLSHLMLPLHSAISTVIIERMVYGFVFINYRYLCQKLFHIKPYMYFLYLIISTLHALSILLQHNET
jgi:hypothetical protein